MRKALAAFIRTHLLAIAWSLTVATIGLALFVWGETNHWQFVGISIYRLFPLFGLIAFSLFWSQYVIAALAQYTKAAPTASGRYFGITSLLVFLALLLHPGLLSYQLWQDGFGLPPGSVLAHFVLPGLGWVVLLGMTSWVIFMFYLVTYKFHTIFQKRKWWEWFGYLGEIAMLAVFYHGFRLGDQLEVDWFRGVWLGYGIILIIILLYFHKDHLRRLMKRLVKK